MITASLLSKFDQYLEEFVYQQIWKALSAVEKRILRSFDSDEQILFPKSTITGILNETSTRPGGIAKRIIF